jgi:hypothetical protein
MTRDEAARILQNRHWNNPLAFVDSLEALGLLKLETPTRCEQLAAQRLENMFVIVTDRDGARRDAVRIHREGAYEIIDILTKSGFKITKEPT